MRLSHAGLLLKNYYQVKLMTKTLDDLICQSDLISLEDGLTLSNEVKQFLAEKLDEFADKFIGDVEDEEVIEEWDDDD
jgi:hypothetical protein